MGGTLGREDNIRGRVMFILEPGVLDDEKQVSHIKKKLLPRRMMMLYI